MNLSRHDLNLLVVLKALLEERNVTRAGERVGLSQPATSNALRRLRREFGDALLVRSGNALELTPLARTLLDMVSATLALAERTYQLTSEFEPAESTRRFTVVGSDYGLSLLAEPLRRLDTLAPGIRIELKAVRGEHLRDPDTVLRRFDLLVAPRGWLHGFPSVPLLADGWVGIVDRDNDQVGEAMTREDLTRTRLVALFDEPSGGAHILRQLDVLGIDPAGRISVESFFEVPLLVEHTGRLGLVPRRLVTLFEHSTHIRSVTLPFDATDLTEALYWHRFAEPDPGHRWLRTLLSNQHSRTGEVV